MNIEITENEYHDLVSQAYDYLSNNNGASGVETLKTILAHTYDASVLSLELFNLGICDQRFQRFIFGLIVGRLHYGRIPTSHPLRELIEILHVELTMGE